MRIKREVLPLTWLLLIVGGCSQQAVFDELVPKEEVAIARRLFSQLAAKNYAIIEEQLDTSVRSSSHRGVLEQMAAMFPAEEPKSVSTVGWNTSVARGVTTYNLTLEYEYSSSWLLANAVLRRDDDAVTVLGLHTRPMLQSLMELNRFTFEGKSAIHYIVFAFAVAVPLFIVYALVVCLKTTIARRKWLWLLFVALGFVRLSLNWADGSFNIQPVSFSLLGAGFFRPGPYAPWILSVAIPVGAIVFLAKRRSIMAQSAG